MSSAEFLEWMVYYGLEPFGELRGDLRAGVIASTIANVHRDKKSKSFKPSDFLLFSETGQESQPETPEEQKQAVINLFRGIGLKVVDG